ncbi:unnamed protein product [Polarella glacialis]|uniref:E3 ubiquitin-protein ligase n=1 Tax=Polarella glacialis TaxID=89957 RepID=A0A813K561_POLGL|nr:unnamed protein product [Polarella glacialis]
MSAKKRKASSQGVEGLLECPVCMIDPMPPPILQCRNGHALCAGCAKQLRNCPSCQATPLNIRCLMLEKAAETMMVACVNAPTCTEMVKYGDLSEHIKDCQFKPIPCPALSGPCDCTALAMDQNVLVAHLKEKHQIELRPLGTWSIANPTGVKVGNWHDKLIQAHGSHFLARTQARTYEGSLVYVAWVQCIGTKKEGIRFKYEVSATGAGRSLIFRSHPRSISESAQRISDSSDCLIVRRSLAHFMSGKENDEKGLNLQMHVRILLASTPW